VMPGGDSEFLRVLNWPKLNKSLHLVVSEKTKKRLKEHWAWAVSTGRCAEGLTRFVSVL
jgi:hypothetical protein